MEKNYYQILRNRIPNVKLYSLTEEYWYDSSDNLIPWSGGTGLYPEIGQIVFNVSASTITSGYYQWSGSIWNLYTGQIVPDCYLPIYLESSVDEFGVMVGFDGEITQIEQLCNFTYTQTGSTIQVYNTADVLVLRKIFNQVFTIHWGDGSTSSIVVSDGTPNANLPSVTHTYSSSGNYTISITLDSPWTKQRLSKAVTTPQNLSIQNPLGTFSGYTIPYTTITSQTQNYLNDLDYTNNTGNTTISFAAIGKSRISELKLYGANTYSGVTTGTTNGMNFSAYTIDGLYYMDFDDGYTTITGSTVGYTKEEVFNNMITRNEHFLGFIDDPTIYSDIFVERGRQGVMENNLRLGEIDNMSELDVYGNGYFNVKKQ
jgi:hypothetical protein